MEKIDWITPNWPAPVNVKALTTCRRGNGVFGFNLALHVGDDPKVVLGNRQHLLIQAQLLNEPLWLNQVHGTNVVEITKLNFSQSKTPPEADASISWLPNQVCAVLTGDCLPILICDKSGTRVSAIHAGWRGLAAGVIEAAIQKLCCPPEQLLVWLGPAIGPTVFEVGKDVLEAFQDCYTEECFKPTSKGTWLADIYQLAIVRLHRLGIVDIFGAGFCTYSDTERFYSFRRSNKTGRMASLIWFTAP